MLTKEIFEEEFMKLYSLGLSTTEICNKLNENRNRGYKLLRRKNLNSHIVPTAITKEEIDIIISEYQSGKTIEDLASLHPNLKEGTITYWLRKKGVTRKNGKVAHLNEDYFEIINTPKKAYFLGLLSADGSIIKNKNKGESYTISLELKIIDKYIIEEFAREIQTDLQVKEYKREEQMIVKDKIYNFTKHNAYLRVHSVKMAQDLIKWGCGIHKTDNLKEIPDIPQHLKKWFLLGFFDGDGIASDGKSKYLGFCGTEAMMSSIRDYFNKELNLFKNIYYNKSNKIYYIQYSLNTGMQNLYKYFYEDNNLIYLHRKKEKIEKILKEKQLI